MTRLKAHIDICRFDHWIKNIFVLPGVLLALGVATQSLDAALAWRFIVGMLATGLIASSNYVLNEILDAPFDRLHARKKHRAVASGRVSIPLAYAQWIALMLVGLALAWTVSLPLALTLTALWLAGCAYNIPPLRAKDVPYLDVVAESVNNPLRMLAGWYIVGPGIFPSTTLLLSYWMLGGYLMTLKRYAELRDLGGEKAKHYRKSLAAYDENTLLVATMFYAAASMLFLGAFIMRYRLELIFSFPFVAWVMALYMKIAFRRDSAVQAPEKLYREPLLMFAVGLCAAVMIALYFTPIPALSEIFSPTMPVY